MILAACSAEQANKDVEKVSDSEIRKIFSLQDQRKSDSLISYFKHPDPALRALAVQAFASIQDSAKIADLFSVLLNDEDVSVRRAAAFSLGQSYDSTAAHLLLQSLDQESSTFVRREILEAIGKCIAQPDLAKFNLFEPENESEKEGFSWGLYRAGSREVHDAVSVARAVEFLPLEESYETRLAAAHFLGRTRKIDVEPHVDKLVEILNGDKSSDIRMQLVSALGKSSSEKALNYQISMTADSDPRVRVNALRSLSGHRTAQISSLYIDKLSDPDTHVAITASEQLLNRREILTPELFEDLSLSGNDWRVRTNMYEILQEQGEINLVPELKIDLEASDNPFEKAALLRIIGTEIKEYEYVVTHTFGSASPEMQEAGIRVLTNLVRREDFPAQLLDEFTEVFKSAMLSGNEDLTIYGTAALLRMPDPLEDEERLRLVEELKKGESTPLRRRSIWMLEGHDEDFEEGSAEKPIDWNSIVNLKDEEEVLLKTTKGNIRIILSTMNAPGSVINFLELVERKFYNGVGFHRVVPNFVVQGGRNRGKDFSDMNYTLRSEFGMMRYETGTLGMASAGKDTETTQFFITHSPTPHLDGAYTVFGSVIEGTEVVNQLQVGDKIVEIQRIQ